jgi:hypothetical protein
MVLINSWIISNRILRYTTFWWWYRLMSHEGFRFDDYHLWKEFWSSLNGGWLDMNYQAEFEKFWGEGSYPPEKIVLPAKDFDALVERLNEPPDPKAIERLTEILRKPAPWDE